MNDPLRTPLDERLAALPLDVAPPRNLWPEISARLTARRPSRTMWIAAAAAMAGACIAGALTWAVVHTRPAAPVVASSAAALFQEPRDPAYLSARATLVVSFRERLAELDPETRARVEASLAAIRKAHEDIAKALASDPASPVLEQLWQSTGRDELDLYDRVVRGTQHTLTRT
jgi:hypothetical protein